MISKIQFYKKKVRRVLGTVNVSNNGKSTPKHAGLVTLFSQCKVHNRNKRWGPQQIPVLGCQPAADQSHKHSDRLPLLSARPAVTSPAAELITAHWLVPNYTAW